MPEIQLTIHSASFFAPANASPENGINEWVFFNFYVPLHRKKRAHDTTSGRLYHYLNHQISAILNDHPKTSPFLKDVAQIRNSGIPFLQKGRIKPSYAPEEIYQISQNDIYSCPTTNEKAARVWLETEGDLNQIIWKTKNGAHYPHLSFINESVAAIHTKHNEWHQNREIHAYDADVVPSVLTTPQPE